MKVTNLKLKICIHLTAKRNKLQQDAGETDDLLSSWQLISKTKTRTATAVSTLTSCLVYWKVSSMRILYDSLHWMRNKLVSCSTYTLAWRTSIVPTESRRELICVTERRLHILKKHTLLRSFKIKVILP